MKALGQWIRQHWHISVILLVGTVLRFWRFWAIPFSHDELSALKRTGFSSFSELIDGAVRLDGHPAGVQVLLWLQSSLGFEAWWIKLPFLIAGVWCIWLMYLIGNRLFNASAGVISAAFMATLQYPITYSQWARPYILGLLVVLGLTYVLLRIRESEGNAIKYLFAFAILAALAGYIHYFALLQAILISAAFVPFVPRKKLPWIALGALVGFVLWLPHLGITLYHLGQGGIGDWLNPPTSDYWWQMLKYVFQFSIWPVAIVVLAGIKQLVQVQVWVRSYLRWMLVGLAILPYIIGYYYSIHVNPLLHQGVLIFAFPFLVLWMSSFIRIDRVDALAAFVLFLLVANVNTLVSERGHFYLNYHSEYETTLDWAAQLQSEDSDLAVVLDLRADLIAFMMENGISEPIDYQYATRMMEENRLQAYLDGLTSSKVCFGMNAGTNPEVFAAVLDHYPCIEAHKYFHVGEAYLLSRNCDSRNEISKQPIADETLISDHPYSSGWEWEWSELNDSTNIHFVASYRAVSADASIVTEIKSPERETEWRGVQLQRFYSEAMLSQKAYHVLYNSEMHHTPTDVLKAFVWLNNAEQLELESFKAYAVPMNTNKYQLFRK